MNESPHSSRHSGEYEAERHLPSHHNPLPGLTDDENFEPASKDYLAISESIQFIELRRRFRRFAFPMTLAFLVWYFAYVLLSTYAEDLMSTRLGGSAITLGLVLGVLQFVTTFLITWLYVRHANKSLDPMAAQLKAQLEGGPQ